MGSGMLHEVQEWQNKTLDLNVKGMKAVYNSSCRLVWIDPEYFRTNWMACNMTS
jgi:hypothetical protein